MYQELFPVRLPDSYLIKFDLSERVFKEPKVKFHTELGDDRDAFKRSVHVRSAYRNDVLDNSYTSLRKK